MERLLLPGDLWRWFNISYILFWRLGGLVFVMSNVKCWMLDVTWRTSVLPAHSAFIRANRMNHTYCSQVTGCLQPWRTLTWRRRGRCSTGAVANRRPVRARPSASRSYARRCSTRRRPKANAWSGTFARTWATLRPRRCSTASAAISAPVTTYASQRSYRIRTDATNIQISKYWAKKFIVRRG